MGHGTVITNQTSNPLWHLPITDPRCMNASCEAFVLGYNASQDRYPNTLFLNFGIWTVLFWASLIAVFALLHLRHRLADYNQKSGIGDRALGLWRFCTYRRLNGRLGEQLDLSYGVLVLLAMATVFLAVLPFYQGFFVREEFRYGSPPLSVRCAMVTSALTPVLMMLAGKMSLVTVLTGVSYAKLNVWHRFVGYAIFVLAIVHTVPHIYAPIKEGGLPELTHLYAIHRREFSGTFLLAAFVMLIVLSLPFFRARFYEIFKHAHIALAIAWFALMFWHIRNEYMAPEFFYAAVGVWALSVLARVIYRNRFARPFGNATRGFSTTLESLPGDMTRVVVSAPRRMRWMPGQHCYISIPGISSLGNHPFTIASAPRSRSADADEENEMVFLVRECSGFTKILGTYAKSISALSLLPSSSSSSPPRSGTSSPPSGATAKFDPASRQASTSQLLPLPSPTPTRDPSPHRSIQISEPVRPTSRSTLRAPSPSFYPPTRHASLAPSIISSSTDTEAQTPTPHVHTYIDGPFGDYQRPLHRHHEGFLTVAGGSGVTASLPWLVYLTRKMRQPSSYTSSSSRRMGGECSIRTVSFIWSVRKAEWITWARREIVTALRYAAQSEGHLRVVIYVTGRDTSIEELESARLDLVLAAGLKDGVERANVDIRSGRPEMDKVLPEFLDDRRNMVRVCGPNALKSGVANAVAGLQRLVLRGEVRSIALDSETFGW